jgi:hypothetical protein
MASACTEAPANRIAALITQDVDWTYEDAEAILEQGMPPCMKECWDDASVVYDFCHQLVNPPEDDNSEL